MTKELEQIDNSNPSKALECLEYLIKECVGNDKYVFESQLNTIKQALIKSQEDKKEIKRTLERWLALLETDGIDSKSMVATDIQRLLEEIK